MQNLYLSTAHKIGYGCASLLPLVFSLKNSDKNSNFKSSPESSDLIQKVRQAELDWESEMKVELAEY